MKTYLVTGAAGFIGANFIKYLLNRKYKNEDIKVIILDALTYAGNLGTIKNDIDNKRCVFVKGDIRDRELADKLFAENDIDKLWDDHLVKQRDDGSSLIYIDRHLLHEVTSPQAFEGLQLADRQPWRLSANVATPFKLYLIK